MSFQFFITFYKKTEKVLSFFSFFSCIHITPISSYSLFRSDGLISPFPISCWSTQHIYTSGDVTDEQETHFGHWLITVVWSVHVKCIGQSENINILN